MKPITEEELEPLRMRLLESIAKNSQLTKLEMTA